MIHSALTFITDILNEEFKNEFALSENKVVLQNIINPDGSAAKNVDDKIVFFLLNLEEETTIKNNINRSSSGNSSFAQKRPPIQMNLHLIFCANFVEKNYEEGLRYLSALIRFFQNNSRLDPVRSGRNMKNSRLLFEMCKLDYSELSHVWSAIGSKIMPSVIYKVRLLAMDDGPIDSVVPIVKEPKKPSEG